MGQLFHTPLIEILLMCSISLPGFCIASGKAMPTGIQLRNEEKFFVRPSDLVVREKSDSPLVYQFITDYPHPHVPTSNYIKPWDVVASKSIRVKNTDALNRRILKRNNILFLSKANEAQENGRVRI